MRPQLTERNERKLLGRIYPEATSGFQQNPRVLAEGAIRKVRFPDKFANATEDDIRYSGRTGLKGCFYLVDYPTRKYLIIFFLNV